MARKLQNINVLRHELKPMLAHTIKDTKKLDYPVMATPKIDGIRCLTDIDGTALTRSLKEVPNRYIQKCIKEFGVAGLDGELWINGAGYFGEVSSAVMRESGEPKFEYIVFDVWDTPDWTYTDRVERLKQKLKTPRPSFFTILEPVKVMNEGGLLKYWDHCVDAGYEGLIIKEAGSVYKYGRSTLSEGIMGKLKKFEDGEAEIIGYEEQMHNDNPPKKNKLGHTERSTAKAGLVPMGMLGKFIVKDIKTGVEFDVGTGFDEKLRKKIWKSRKTYVGMVLKYKHQPIGSKTKPRHPVFLGFRDARDM